MEWERSSMLAEGRELASDVDFTIPRTVATIEDAIAIVRDHRTEWLAAQRPQEPR